MTEDGTRYLVWPRGLRTPDVDLPDGYALRSYQPEDREVLRELLANAGWNLGRDEIQAYLDCVLPNGLFFAVDRETGVEIATGGALHNPDGGDYHFPFGGEVGYLYVDPAHRRQGLGRALTAASVRRLDAAGYRRIWVGDVENPAAIRLYLDMGFTPFLYRPELVGRWRDIFDELDIPFDPSRCVEPPLR